MKKSNRLSNIISLLKISCSIMVLFTYSSLYGQESIEIELEAGQVVSFITSRAMPESSNLRSEYFRRMMPSASEKGFSSEGSFRIKSVRFYGTSAESHVEEGNIMSFFSWPNQSAIKSFREETPDWSELEKMRPKIWEELRITRMTINNDLKFKFDSDKIYRIVFVWLNQDNPGNLARYQEAIKETRDRLGARYVIQWDKVDYYHSFTDPTEVPDQAWIIEWPNTEAHRAYLSSEAFSQNIQYFMSGISRFEAYETEFIFPETN